MTLDYSNRVFLPVYHDFVNSSGRVTIGNNVYFGVNCTVLKNVTIGDNCIIGANSLVTKNIPSNFVAVGSPAKVIYGIEEYYLKRKKEAVLEAIEYVKTIRQKLNRNPTFEDLFEEFGLSIDGSEIDSHPMNKVVRIQLGDEYEEWKKRNKPAYKDLESFLKYAYDLN